jgi:GINS complex subunit 2
MYHLLDFLQEQLTRETSRPEFSRLPFRFAEIAKVILDVLANTFVDVEAVSDFHQAPQMMCRMQTKSSHY